MTESNVSKLPPSQKINDEYTFKLLGILSRAAQETAKGWSKLGLLLNFDRSSNNLLTYSEVVWRDEHYDSWISEKEQGELITAALYWLKALMEAGFDHWTAIFLGLDSNRRFVWIPNYDADYGPWKIDFDGDNWPAVEEGLKKL